MSVTYQMLVDALDFDRSAYRASLSSRPQLRYVSDGKSWPAGEDDDATLVVASPIVCLEVLSAHDELFALCKSSPSFKEAEDELVSTGRCMVVDTDLSDSGLFAMVVVFFQKMNAWERELDRLLLSNGSLGDLLDVSAPVLACPLVMSGVGLRLVAYSSMLPTDPMVQRSIEKGYFDEEALDYFRSYGMSAVWNAVQGITLIEQKSPTRDYPIIFYIFRVHNDYYLHLTIHLDRRCPSEGLNDELRILIDAIDRHIELHPPSAEILGTGLPALLSQVARGDSAITPHVRDQLRELGIDDETPYRLHLVDYGLKPDERQIAMNHAMDLLMRVPESLVAVLDACALVLEVRPRGERSVPQTLADHAEHYDCRLAVSDTMRGVAHVSLAYWQTRAAREVLQLRNSVPEGETTFTEVFVDYLLLGEGRNERLVRACLDSGILVRLRDEDKRQGSDDFHLLEVYLSCECEASSAARRLSMHRNSLLYRIHRIEQRFGIQLGNAATRERMRIEYHLLNLSIFTK